MSFLFRKNNKVFEDVVRRDVAAKLSATMAWAVVEEEVVNGQIRY